MVTVIRPSRARCVRGTIPRHERVVFTFKEAGFNCTTPAASSWRTPPSRVGSQPCVGVRSSRCPKAIVHIAHRRVCLEDAAKWDPQGSRRWSDREAKAANALLKLELHRTLRQDLATSGHLITV